MSEPFTDEPMSPACTKCEQVTGKSTCFPGPCVFYHERNVAGTKANNIATLGRIRRGKESRMIGPPICETVYTGEDGWSDWIHPHPHGDELGYLLQCCDCGLIHEMEFAIGEFHGNGPLNEGESEEGGIVVFRARRHAPQADPRGEANLIAAAPDLYEALELADCLLSGANMNKRVVEKKVRAALAKARPHTSDCALHNEPALPAGPCDCGGEVK